MFIQIISDDGDMYVKSANNGCSIKKIDKFDYVQETDLDLIETQSDFSECDYKFVINFINGERWITDWDIYVLNNDGKMIESYVTNGGE